MVAAIYPAHMLSAGIGSVFIVKQELNSIVNSFFRSERLARLILAENRRYEQRRENDDERKINTDDTEAQRT